jgi:hypothetical protein
VPLIPGSVSAGVGDASDLRDVLASDRPRRQLRMRLAGLRCADFHRRPARRRLAKRWRPAVPTLRPFSRAVEREEPSRRAARMRLGPHWDGELVATSRSTWTEERCSVPAGQARRLPQRRRRRLRRQSAGDAPQGENGLHAKASDRDCGTKGLTPSSCCSRRWLKAARTHGQTYGDGPPPCSARMARVL